MQFFFRCRNIFSFHFFLHCWGGRMPLGHRASTLTTKNCKFNKTTFGYKHAAKHKINHKYRQVERRASKIHTKSQQTINLKSIRDTKWVYNQQNCSKWSWNYKIVTSDLHSCATSYHEFHSNIQESKLPAKTNYANWNLSSGGHQNSYKNKSTFSCHHQRKKSTRYFNGSLKWANICQRSRNTTYISIFKRSDRIQ